MESTNILDSRKIAQKLERIAHQIYEYNSEEKEIILVGVAPRGFELSNRLAGLLNKISDLKVRIMPIYVDKDHPTGGDIKLDGDLGELTNSSVCLVDDVLNSGRTLMYAARHILSTPIKKLNTVVLIDRRHRKFPIRADLVGITLSTTIQEHISVDLQPGKEGAYLE